MNQSAIIDSLPTNRTWLKCSDAIEDFMIYLATGRDGKDILRVTMATNCTKKPFGLTTI